MSDFNENIPRRRQRIIYHGRVQGVGFRYTVSRIAARLPVAGYVRNLQDGTVELVAEAVPDVLEKFYREIAGAFITNITAQQVEDLSQGQPMFQFEIRR